MSFHEIICQLHTHINVSGEFKSVPSSTLNIKFPGQFLPKYVYIFKIHHEVSHFIPKIKVCYKCFRVGYISALCKGSPRCLKRELNRHESERSCPVLGMSSICINCKGDHLVTSPDCPIAIRQKMIASIVAIDNISLFEARKMIRQNLSNPNTNNSHVSSFDSRGTYNTTVTFLTETL